MERRTRPGFSGDSEIPRDKKATDSTGSTGSIAFEIIRSVPALLPPKVLSMDELLKREKIFERWTIYQ